MEKYVNWSLFYYWPFQYGYLLAIAQLSKYIFTTRMKIIKNIKLVPISFIELKDLSDSHY